MMKLPSGLVAVRFPLLLQLALILSIRPAAASIHYKISLDHPEQHTFFVQMTVEPPGNDLTVALPAWNALYNVRDFAHRVRDVRASVPGPRPVYLDVLKLDKQTWRISLARAAAAPITPSVVIEYSITWNDPGPFNSQFNEHHAFMNLAEILMYVPDRRNEESLVTIEHLPPGWRVITELPAVHVDNSFVAPNYDTLVDAPVEAGRWEEFDFDNSGAHFRVVMDAKDWRKSLLEGYIHRITEYELKLMGGPPFKEYTFFIRIGPYLEVGGGGMEHANSTAISSGSVEGAVSIAAHEFFHAWNVKRIRPQALEPVDYTKEQYTRALWFAEGVTSTYGAYTLERSGLWSKDEFLGDIASQIGELQSRPAHTWQSAEESSLDTWLDKYDEYKSPTRSISYYNKGQILGVMLDLAIRDATDNLKSLDDVLRRMNAEYAQPGKFYNDSEGIRSVVEEVAGKSFEDFFRRYVAGTDEIPYDAFLSAAGLELKIETRQAANLGFLVSRVPGSGIVVSQVDPGSAAEATGLRAGDLLLELNGQPLGRAVSEWQSKHSPGETVKVHIRREGEESDLSFAVGARATRNYSVIESPQATEKQRRIRNGILRGVTD